MHKKNHLGTDRLSM